MKFTAGTLEILHPKNRKALDRFWCIESAIFVIFDGIRRTSVCIIGQELQITYSQSALTREGSKIVEQVCSYKFPLKLANMYFEGGNVHSWRDEGGEAGKQKSNPMRC